MKWPGGLVDEVCPLKVVRRRYQDETDDYLTYIDVCGEALWLEFTESHYLHTDGSHEPGADATWKVTCCNGHVVLLADNGGDDTEIPFAPEYLTTALERQHGDA